MLMCVYIYIYAVNFPVSCAIHCHLPWVGGQQLVNETGFRGFRCLGKHPFTLFGDHINIGSGALGCRCR